MYIKEKKQEVWRDSNFCSERSGAMDKILDMEHSQVMTRTGTWWLWEGNVKCPRTKQPNVCGLMTRN